jgi:hypothetical protein
MRTFAIAVAVAALTLAPARVHAWGGYSNNFSNSFDLGRRSFEIDTPLELRTRVNVQSELDVGRAELFSNNQYGGGFCNNFGASQFSNFGGYGGGGFRGGLAFGGGGGYGGGGGFLRGGLLRGGGGGGYVGGGFRNGRYVYYGRGR